MTQPYETNDRGGWIIPDKSVVIELLIPAYSEIGNGTTFGYGTTFGDETTFGNGTKFGDGTTFSNGTTFGNGTKFGDGTKFGYGTTFGDETTFGNWNTFGDGTKFGDGTEIEGVENAKLFCLSNLDGSGRQIQIIVDNYGEKIVIRAGCFRGTLDEFCQRSISENKMIYAGVVRAAAEAFKLVIKQ
jgi:NDP-sugar pyrophosphorylase family protein